MRIGVDLGGTKILSAVLDEAGAIIASRRDDTPRDDYVATINAIKAQVLALESELDRAGLTVGIGIPGSAIPSTQLIQNANSTWLNKKPLPIDIADALARPIRIENDANCFALSEAVDGAASGASSVFGVILGTGVGGGLVYDMTIVNGL